jgi:hypothetical protein
MSRKKSMKFSPPAAPVEENAAGGLNFMLDGHRDLTIVGYFLRQRIVSPSRKPCSITIPSEERHLRRS